MQAMVQGVERRARERYRCGGRVEIPRSYSCVPLYGVVVDLSEGGCGICIPSGADFEPDENDAACEVELRFKTSYLSFRAKGTIQSTHRHAGFGGVVVGLRFTTMSARGRGDVAAFLRDREDAGQTRTAAREMAFA